VSPTLYLDGNFNVGAAPLGIDTFTFDQSS
jgi:hypothetical protein